MDKITLVSDGAYSAINSASQITNFDQLIFGILNNLELSNEEKIEELEDLDDSLWQSIGGLYSNTPYHDLIPVAVSYREKLYVILQEINPEYDG